MRNRDGLLERLRELDPADPARLASASHGEHELREEILATPVDQLAARRARRRRLTAMAIAAAIVAAGLLVPIALLLPLGDDAVTTPASTPPTTGSPPSSSPSTGPPPSSGAITVTDPAPGATVTSPLHLEGTADVFEATVSIRIMDATNNVIADTTTMATCGSGCRGDFVADVPFEVGIEQNGVIQIFEVSAMDGSRINTVRIPVTLVPGAPDPVASEVEGTWFDPEGVELPAAAPGDPLVLHVFEGPDHCGWTSVSMLHVAWPLGSEAETGGEPWRQYLRDPHGVLADRVAVPFDGDATLPADAVDTGYHRGDWHLWISPRMANQAVFLVNGDQIELWPRSVPMPALCD